MRYIFTFLFFFPINILATDSPSKVVSIRPLQSIIANLTKDVDNNIGLIIDTNESLHNYSLKPTKIREIQQAKMLILIDRNFEIFLDKVYDRLKYKNLELIEVAKLPNVKLLSNSEDSHEEEHDHHHHHLSQYDYHLWLDIDIVKAIARELTTIFIIKDKDHKQQYMNNLKTFLTKLDKLDLEIKKELTSARYKDFVVTHNAYQYFIKHYNLNQPQSITIDHDHSFGAASFAKVQSSLKDKKIQCIFEEPQFKSSIIEKLRAENKEIKIGILDAEWGENNISIEDVYFSMMSNLARNFKECLN